jgi:uncharacterized protein YjdB
MSFPENPRYGVATTLTVTPASSILIWGATVQLTPALSDSAGTPVDASQPFVYKSSNTALVNVSDTGLCTVVDEPTEALAPGAAQVTVTITYPWAGSISTGATISAEATLTVLASPSESVPINLLFIRGGPGAPVSSKCPARVSKNI